MAGGKTLRKAAQSVSARHELVGHVEDLVGKLLEWGPAAEMSLHLCLERARARTDRNVA